MVIMFNDNFLEKVMNEFIQFTDRNSNESSNLSTHESSIEKLRGQTNQESTTHKASKSLKLLKNHSFYSSLAVSKHKTEIEKIIDQTNQAILDLSKNFSAVKNLGSQIVHGSAIQTASKNLKLIKERSSYASSALSKNFSAIENLGSQIVHSSAIQTASENLKLIKERSSYASSALSENINAIENLGSQIVHSSAIQTTSEKLKLLKERSLYASSALSKNFSAFKHLGSLMVPGLEIHSTLPRTLELLNYQSLIENTAQSFKFFNDSQKLAGSMHLVFRLIRIIEVIDKIKYCLSGLNRASYQRQSESESKNFLATCLHFIRLRESIYELKRRMKTTFNFKVKKFYYKIRNPLAHDDPTFNKMILWETYERGELEEVQLSAFAELRELCAK